MNELWPAHTSLSCKLTAVPHQPNAGPSKMFTRAPLMVVYKKSYVMLHLEAEWTSKENILIADIILAVPGP